MKPRLSLAVILMLAGALYLSSCRKNDETNYSQFQPQLPTAQVPIPCVNRPIINARLIPVGSLSEARIGIIGGTVGSQVIFAGGIKPGNYSSRIDIYDTITKRWSTAELSVAARQGMAVATVGSKILFAGGGDNDWVDMTSRIDIYDAANNIWSTAELSQARKYLAAVTCGSKVFLAGGGTWEQPVYTGSDIVDIYDANTNSWTISHLSSGRFELSAATNGDQIFFSGGYGSIRSISDAIDIYDTKTNRWSTSSMVESRGSHASIIVNNKLLLVGGANTPYWNGFNLASYAEVRDISTGTSSYVCNIPKSHLTAVVKGEDIIFFTGMPRNTGYSGTHFDIYNTKTDEWSTGVLPQSINDASIVSANGTVYIAGGRSATSGSYVKEVWKLEF